MVGREPRAAIAKGQWTRAEVLASYDRTAAELPAGTGQKSQPTSVPPCRVIVAEFMVPQMQCVTCRVAGQWSQGRRLLRGNTTMMLSGIETSPPSLGDSHRITALTTTLDAEMQPNREARTHHRSAKLPHPLQRGSNVT